MSITAPSLRPSTDEQKTRLERLLRPRSLAIFGGTWAAAVVRQSQAFGFSGDLWPVHPSRGDLCGLPCHRSIEELPRAPDAAFVGVNRDATIDIVRRLAAAGAGGAVCFASGFKESGGDGEQRQRALVEAAASMPFLGPNCYGFINSLDGALLWPDIQGTERIKRGVAMIVQSSNMAITLTLNGRSLPIAYMITLGNQATIGLAEVIRVLADDDRVSAIGLHIEGINDPEAFAEAVFEARDRGKPLAAIKMGKSPAAAAITLTHTASLAGADAVADAYLRRLGIARVPSMPALLETLKLLHSGGPLPSNRLVTLSCSGGEAALLADSAEGRDLEFQRFNDADKERIGKTLNPLVTLSNPFDYHTFDWNQGPRLEATFTAVAEAEQDLTALVIDYPYDKRDRGSWDLTAQAFTHALETSGSRGALISTLPECLPASRRRALLECGIAPLQGVDEALIAIEAAAFIGAANREHLSLPALTPLTAGEAETLDEERGKKLLARYGVPIPANGTRCREPAEAIAAGRKIKSKGMARIAMKAISATLTHKTEAGGVVLDIVADDSSAIEKTFAQLAPLGEAVLVEAMAPPAAAELIVGVVRDAEIGPHLLVGLGGIFAEALRDTGILLLPSSRAQIEQALLNLSGAALLRGWRNRPAADLKAAVAAIESIQACALDRLAEIEELEVNPLIVGTSGACAADALIRLRRPPLSNEKIQ